MQNIKILSTLDSVLSDDHPSMFVLPDEPAEPEFAESETNVTAQLGASIFLHCPVINSGDRAVSYPSVSAGVDPGRSSMLQYGE
jgi:hypothetical protein